jgi:hypothetical protein
MYSLLNFTTMKRTYSLFQKYTSCGLLISLLLQSCGGALNNNPLILTQEGQPSYTQTNIPQASIDPLVDQQLTAQGGHTINFYEEAGELKANVEMNAPQGFTKTYQGINVCVEQGAELSKLPQLDTKAQQRRIQLQSAQDNRPARVVIYKGAGLAGGGKDGKNKKQVLPGEEEAEEDEEIEEKPS